MACEHLACRLASLPARRLAGRASWLASKPLLALPTLRWPVSEATAAAAAATGGNRKHSSKSSSQLVGWISNRFVRVKDTDFQVREFRFHY